MSDSAVSDRTAAPDAPPAARPGEPRRVRFVSLRVSRTPAGRGRAEVELERTDGRRVSGAADVQPTADGDLRAAAAATLEALHLASDTAHRFALLGVKRVRAFDQHVVLVQLGVAGDPARDAGGGPGPTRLVGAAVADADLMRATVLAVLNATNRVLWGPSLG